MGRATAIVLALAFGSDRLLSVVCEIRCADHALDSHHCVEVENTAGPSVSAAGHGCVHAFVRFTPESMRTHFAVPPAVVSVSDIATALMATHPGRVGRAGPGHAPPRLVLRV